MNLPTAAEWVRWGIHPTWSRTASVTDRLGRSNTWHWLETGPPQPVGTIVCVHGNPTWSVYWRSFLKQFGDRYRVIAFDHLGMGFSQRTVRRRYADRVDDLDSIISALGVTGKVVLAAHDWGGAIAMGWAVRNPERVQAMVFTNTGIAIPEGLKVPALIRIAGVSALNNVICARTPLFVGGTPWLPGTRLDKTTRQALMAPYRTAASRVAVAQFVDDVPFTDQRPSAGALADVASKLGSITAPVLLAWGGRDPVFSDEFADDLARRFTGAIVSRHRFANAGHLVVEEADVAGVADEWLTTTSETPAPASSPGKSTSRIWEHFDDRRLDAAQAFVDLGDDQRISFHDLYERVERTAVGLRSLGIQPGDRVALLVPPSIDLVVAVYSCWRAGAVTVIADRGLGLRALARAVRGSGPRWVIAAPRALPVVRALRAAPSARLIATGSKRRVGTVAALDILAVSGDEPLAMPQANQAAAVLFTSGATGPAKGVRYTHEQLAAQRDALASTYNITSTDRLVAAFAPFALYGPALGITSTIPAVDVTKPASLTAAALSAACSAVDATIVFASPSALANVVTTANHRPGGPFERLRLVLSAGAPVPIATLRAAQQLFPAARLCTPYGMTEALPVANADRQAIEAAGPGRGVYVGRPVVGARVRIVTLGIHDHLETATVPVGHTGEVWVSSPWLSDGYDRLWRTERDARCADSDGVVWHRSGDVGHVDGDDLWIEGRSVHVITATTGPVTPVPIEVAVEQAVPGCRVAAAGVGPAGCQQVVVVIEQAGATAGLADRTLVATVRAAVAPVPVAAVLVVASLPVDIRHNAKVDRTAVGKWATTVLAGGTTRTAW